MMVRLSATPKIAIMDKRYVATALAVAIGSSTSLYCICFKGPTERFPIPRHPTARLEEPKLRQQSAKKPRVHVDCSGFFFLLLVNRDYEISPTVPPS
jgi:hypothetical protein